MPVSIPTLLLALTTVLAPYGVANMPTVPTTSATSTSAGPVPPAVVINPRNWVPTDLSKVSAKMRVIVNLPKDAKLEKGGLGTVIVTLSLSYQIVVSKVSGTNVKQWMGDMKTMTVENDEYYTNPKVLKEDATGMVYSVREKASATNRTPESEAHFVYFLPAKTQMYSFQNLRPEENKTVSGSAYTDAIALQVYDLLKASAKAQ